MASQTEIDFLIHGADYLLEISPEYGVFNPFQIMVGFEYDKSAYVISEEDKIRASLNSYDFIVHYASKKGYIFRPRENVSQMMYSLTDLGREIKQKGGHAKYWESIERKENAFFENVKWAKKAADATELSAVYNKRMVCLIAAYTILTFILVIQGVITCNQNKRPQATKINAANSKTEIKANKIRDTVK